MSSNPLINCSDVQPHLFAFSEGLLPEHERQPIIVHLSKCAACAATYQTLRGLNQTIEKEKAVEPDPFLSTRLLQHIESGIERQQHDLIFKIKPVFQPLLITLGLLLALFTGVMLGHRETGTNQSVITENSRVDELKTELLINQFVEEDQTLFLNN